MRTLLLPYTDVRFSQMRILIFPPNTDVKIVIYGPSAAPNTDVFHVRTDVFYVRTVYSEGPHLGRSAFGNHRCDDSYILLNL